MPVKAGQRYRTQRGVEFIVVKGAEGAITDEDQTIELSDPNDPSAIEREGGNEYKIGERLTILEQTDTDKDGNPIFTRKDGCPEVLVISDGYGVLLYEGQPLEVVKPKPLPSAD